MRCHVCYEQVISIKYGSYWDRNHFRFVSTVSDIPYYCGSPMWSLCSLKTLPLIKEWLYHTWGNFWTYFLRSFKFSRCPYPLFMPPIFPLLFSSLSFFTFPSCFYFLILLSNFTSFFPDFSLPPLFNCIFFNLNFCFCLTGTQYKIKSSINFLTLQYFIKIKALKIYLQFLFPFSRANPQTRFVAAFNDTKKGADEFRILTKRLEPPSNRILFQWSVYYGKQVANCNSLATL